MAQTTQTRDSFLRTLLLSARSTGFWSYITAIVGVVALLAGGILYLTIEETRNFSVSVLIIGIALLFLALVLSPRAVAIFLVGRQGRYGANTIVMTVAFFVIVVLVNFLLFRNPTRVDVTATRVLTLAPQTLQILDNLKGDVRANAFFVPGASRDAFARQQAEDLLNEFKRRGSNRFDYRFIDPELNKSLASLYSVTSYPAIVFEDVEKGSQQGIATFNENEFVTGILVATGVDQKRVYYLTGHNETALTRDISGATQDAGLDFALEGVQRDNYRVLPLNLKQFDQVPADAAVLVIAGPKNNLDGEEFAALTKYIKGEGKERGGRVVALLDPSTPESFVALIAQWGVVITGLSVADAVSNVAGEELTPLIQRANAQYPTNLLGNTGIRITDQLDSAFFPEATSVQPLLPPADMPPFITYIPLAVTTPASWLEKNPEDVSFTPGEDTRSPLGLPIVAVVAAGGTIDERERHPEARLVIFGDSDFAQNKFYSSMNNADFLLNSVNWLAEDYDLIGIRPKIVPFRELVVNTRERDFIKWSSWFVPPAIMLILGAIVWWRRR